MSHPRGDRCSDVETSRDNLLLLHSSPWLLKFLAFCNILDSMLSVDDMDIVMRWLNWTSWELCAVRTCSRHIRDVVGQPDTVCGNFVKVVLLQMQMNQICLKPAEDWTPEAPFCASPYCRRETGLWMPTSEDRLPAASVDSVDGSERISVFLQRHRNYKYVVCSEPCCFRRVAFLKNLRRENGQIVIAVSLYRSRHASDSAA